MYTKWNQKWISLFLCAAMLLTMLPGLTFPARAAAVAGTSGSAEWTLVDGVFTISGGAMDNYASAEEQPWYSYADLITKVVIGEGVSRVGDHAFDGCDLLAEVEVGSSVHAIGAYAFANTPAMTTVVFPKNVTVLCEGLFYQSGLDKLYIYNRKTEFDGYWNIDGSIPNQAVVYCYPCSHFSHYCGDGQKTVMLTDDLIMDIDQGSSSLVMDANCPYYVRDLWSAADTADGMVWDYTFSMNNADIIRIHNEIADEGELIGEEYHNNSKLELEVQVNLRKAEGEDITSLRGSADYFLQEYNLEFEPNRSFGEWDCWVQEEQDFLEISGSGENLTVKLNATMQELEAYAGEPIGYIFVYIAIKGRTHYRSGRYEYDNFPTTAESVGFVIFDARQRESWIEELPTMLTLDQKITVEDWAPQKNWIPHEEYQKYFEPVSRRYVWAYSFARESYFYNEETEEDIYAGSCFWELEGDGAAFETYNGVVYGGIRGTYDAGSNASITIRDMLSPEELEFVETLKGLKPTGDGGEARIELFYTLYVTYADGSGVVLTGGAADEITSLAGVCLHTCSVCGLCTSEDLLACNSRYGWRTNACTCDTPSPAIVASAVNNAEVVDYNAWCGELTVRVETFDAEMAVNTDYFKAIVNSVDSSNVAAVYDITLYNEWGDAYTMNEWGGTEEYLTVSIPVSSEVAQAAANGELILYHVDANGLADEISFTVDTEKNTLTFTGHHFSPYVLVKTVPYYGRTQLTAMSNSAALLYAYDQIAAGVEIAAETIEVYNGTDAISQEELAMVMDAYRRDYAHHFWISGAYHFSCDDTTCLSVTMEYILTGEELKAARTAFDTAVDKILSGLTGGMSEYERELYLHDELAARITYTSGDHAHNAYGALVEGKAVCEGYAKAFQYLLQRAGIQSFIAEGQSKGENHAWNIVKIDGQYYHADLTWNDQENELFHAYFNLTDARIQEDHVIFAAPYALPVCGSDDAFYFTGKNTLLDTYDTDVLGTLLKDNGGNVHVYITGSMDDFWGWMDQNGTAVMEAAGASSLQLSGLGHEVILKDTQAVSYALGDVNHDGYVDGADAMLLRQFVARWKLETFYPENADLDGSGVIDGADAMLLRQLIAG